MGTGASGSGGSAASGSGPTAQGQRRRTGRGLTTRVPFHDEQQQGGGEMAGVRLSDLARAAPEAQRTGVGDPVITGITHDSRRVQPGDLFVCIPGQQVDGHAFLADAVARGAVAGLVERVEGLGVEVPLLRVPTARAVVGPVAAAVYGQPSRQFTLIGVTGTNGKTTTTLLIEALFRAAGCRTGVIGTLGARIGDRELPGDRTTPEAPELQALFAEMAREDVRAVAMEVSSHALALDRTLGTEFDI